MTTTHKSSGAEQRTSGSILHPLCSMLVLCIAVLFLVSHQPANAVGNRPNCVRDAILHPPSSTLAVSKFGAVPMCFEANYGQTPPEVKFLGRGKGYTMFLTPSEAVLVLRKADRTAKYMKGAEEETAKYAKNAKGGKAELNVDGFSH